MLQACQILAHVLLDLPLLFLFADGYVPVAEGNFAEPSEAQSEPGQAEASAGTQVGSSCMLGSICQVCVRVHSPVGAWQQQPELHHKRPQHR